MAGSSRAFCPHCEQSFSRKDTVLHHHRKAHPELAWNASEVKMERPQRTKTESVKARENNNSSSTPAPKTKEEEDPLAKLPIRYLPPPDNTKFRETPTPLGARTSFKKKSKTSGEEIEFELLDEHPVCKNGFRYERVIQDSKTGYFQAADVEPFCAKLSVEDGPKTEILNSYGNIYYSKDKLAVTSEFGYTTVLANVCAKEGTYFYEAKIVSKIPRGKQPNVPATKDPKGIHETGRGNVRVGFARREHDLNINVGSTGYSYGLSDLAVVGMCGSQRLSAAIAPDVVQEGDVIGLIITLPSLELHEKVVQGTYNKAVDGPFVGKTTVPSGKPQSPAAVTGKAPSGTSEKKKKKGKATLDLAVGLDSLSLSEHYHPNTIRDRAPILFKGHAYFEALNYTPHYDLGFNPNPADPKKSKSSTGDTIDHIKLVNPNHEYVHLRTLPGSKIEILINGKYKGVLVENLKAFLPPASRIDPGDKRRLRGAWDDGSLGYYPAVSVMNGGATQVKFDGPWWFGPPSDRADITPFGELYSKQAVADTISDIIDQVKWENEPKDTATAPAPAPSGVELAE